MASSIQLTSAEGQYLSLTTAIDYNGDYTACWWMTNPAGLSNYVGVAGFDVGPGTSTEFDRLHFQKGNKDTQWQVILASRDGGSDSTTTSYSGFVVGGGPWFVTVKRTGNDMSARVYHGTTYTEITLTSGVSSRGSATGTTLGYMPSNTSVATTTAEFAHFKAWSRALTDAGLDLERRFSRAQSRDSIFGEWPMRGGSSLRTLDYSGNGNSLVETNSPTDGTTSFGVAVQPQPILIDIPVEVSSDTSLTPGSVALGVTFHDTSVGVTNNIGVTPSHRNFGFGFYVPSVGVTNNIELTPSHVSLGLSVFAPDTGLDVVVVPGTLSLVLHVITDSDIVVIPGKLSLVAGLKSSSFVVGIRKMLTKVSPTGLDLDELSILHLKDTPENFGTSGQVLVVNSNANGLTFSTVAGGGATAFVDLTDGPQSLGTAGQYIAMNTGATALEWIAPPVIPTLRDTFPSLNDTPADYAGAAGQVVRVNAAGNALEFVVAGALPVTFAGLLDTPDTYVGADDKYLQYNADTGELVFTEVNTSVDPALISLHSLAKTPAQSAANNGKYLRQKADNSYDTEWVSVSGGASTLLGMSDTPSTYGSPGQYLKVSSTSNGFVYDTLHPHAPITLEVTTHEEVVTTGTNKYSFRMPFAATLLGARASVVTAPTGSGGLVVNIRAVGATNTSVFGTNKLTIDNGETTSTTSGTTPTIDVDTLADDILIQIDVDTAAGSPAGLKVTLLLD